MSIEYIRKHYNIPVKQGMRVRVCTILGTIIGTKFSYLKIRLDGEHVTQLYHPTDNIEYLINTNKP